MRILISVQNYHPGYSFGGRVSKAVALAEGLHRIGHEVSVVTSSVIERDNRPQLRTRSECVNGVTVTYLGTLVRLGQISLNPAVLAFAFSRMSRFDAVHIIGLYDALGPPLALAAHRSGVPYSLEPSGMLVPIVRSLRLKKAYHVLFGKFMIRHARALVVTSRTEGRDAIEFGIPSGKIFLRYNGVNPKAYRSPHHRGSFRKRYGIPEQKPLILWLGRIEEKKNLETLIRALAGLKKHQWTLCILGPVESKAYLNTLNQLASRVGIESRLLFLPGLYGDEKLSAYWDADLFVLVSLNENWGNTATEAIAAGVPVLVTRTCGVAEVVEGRAGLVVECNEDSVRAGLETLLSDAVLYGRFKAQLPALADELSWEESARRMSLLFQSWQHY